MIISIPLFSNCSNIHSKPIARFLVAAILVCLICLWSCQNDEKSVSGTINIAAKASNPVHHTNIPVDSFITYSFSDQLYFSGQGFIFSPFEKNKIWLTPQDREAFEFDLQTGKKLSFSEKFGNDCFKTAIAFTGIQTDSFDRHLCWFLTETGVFKYDFSKKSGQFFYMNSPQKIITAITFSSIAVWVGTSSGLWVYDRQSGTCTAVDYSPEIWIKTLQIQSGGKLGINDDYLYDPQTKCWEKAPVAKPGNSLPDHYPPQLTTLNLPYFGGDYRVAFAPEETWWCNSTYWFSCGYSENVLRNFKPPCNNQLWSFIVDSDHLYLLYRECFLIVSKAYLISNLAGDPTLLAKLRHFKFVTDSLQLLIAEPWPDRKVKMAFLHRLFPHEKDPYLLSQMDRLTNYFSLPNDEDSLKMMLKTPGLDTVVIDRIYHQLILKNVENGDLRKVLDFIYSFRKKRPEADYFKSIRQNLSVTEKSLKQLDSIDNIDQPDYERLWARGNVLYWFCTNQSYIGNEVCYNLWLADSALRRLVYLYPDSPRADDADFKLIEYSHCHEGEDGSDHPEEVQQWKNFLQKYPTTELKADVLCKMTWALSREKPALKQGLKWLAEAEKLQPDLFRENYWNNMLWMRKDFQEQLDMLEIEFSIRLKKSRIKAGEQVEILFIIKNPTQDVKSFEGILDSRFPNFSVDITPEEVGNSCLRPVNYIESPRTAFPADRKAYGAIKIGTGKSYTETWDLTKMAHKNQHPNLGSFVFDRPGVYYINGYSRFSNWPKTAGPLALVVE